MKYLTLDQVNDALEKASTTGHKNKRTRNYLIIKTLVESGLRASELVQLMPKNINFSEKMFHVKGKGDKIRSIFIPRDLAIQLKGYIETNKIRQGKSVFPLTREGIFKITNKLSGHGPHAFRHTYAVLMLEKKEVHIRFLQKQMGHASLDTTQVYLDIVESRDQRKKIDNGILT